MKWRRAIGTAVAFTMPDGGKPATNPNELAIIGGMIMDEAAAVGEAEWARRELLPLIALGPPVCNAGTRTVDGTGWRDRVDRLGQRH